LRTRKLRHQRDDVRLRDRLAVADRQRPVVVGVLRLVGIDEQMTRHAAHRIEHPPVVDVAARKLPLHHPRALRGAVVIGIGRGLRERARGYADHRCREQPFADARIPRAHGFQDLRR
jgi:hypothetical protein